MNLYTYCPRCAERLSDYQEGERMRRRCSACGFIHYRNPVPAAGGLIIRDKGICLVRRAVDPRKGFWSLPAGFMEYDESARTCVEREVAEETGLIARAGSILGVYAGFDDPRQNAVLIVFWMVEDEYRHPVAGDDADEVRFFAPDALPKDLAFRAHREALADAISHGQSLAASQKHGNVR